jgi:hypothetical protein
MSRILRRRAVLVVLLVVVGTLMTGAIALAVSSSGAAGTVTRVYANGSDDASVTNSTTFVALPGASRAINVPQGETALVVARFTGESQCSGGAAGNWCSVRIMANGTEMSPASGSDFAFDSVAGSEDFYESHTIERFIVLNAGTTTITVQRAVTSAATNFRLDDYTLIIERAQRTAS